MKTFKFPLQRVLDWRGLQMRTEEEKLAGLQHRMATLAGLDKALTTAEAKTQSDLLASPLIAGMDLQRFAAFQLRIKSERIALRAKQSQCEVQINEQRKRLLKARKDYRVLEKLKEQRWKTWTYMSDREVESTAAESYISKWARPELDGGEA